MAATNQVLGAVKGLLAGFFEKRQARSGTERVVANWLCDLVGGNRRRLSCQTGDCDYFRFALRHGCVVYYNSGL